MEVTHTHLQVMRWPPPHLQRITPKQVHAGGQQHHTTLLNKSSTRFQVEVGHDSTGTYGDGGAGGRGS